MAGCLLDRWTWTGAFQFDASAYTRPMADIFLLCIAQPLRRGNVVCTTTFHPRRNPEAGTNVPYLLGIHKVPLMLPRSRNVDFSTVAKQKIIE